MQSTCESVIPPKNHKNRQQDCCCNASSGEPKKPHQYNKIKQDHQHEHEETSWWRLGIALGCAISAEGWERLHGHPQWITAIFAVLAIFIGGWQTYRAGWQAILRFNLNMNALMSVAVTGAILLNQWSEAAMVLVLFEIAERIEEISLARSRHAINTLLEMAPKEALVQIEHEKWIVLPVEKIQCDMLVRVKPGERISLDGVVIAGHSAVDQAAITGESIPVEKKQNDPVFAGTLNQNGMLVYRVTATSQDTVLTRIIQMVEEAQIHRAPVQRFVDQFAKVYTPLVFGIALCVAILPPLIMGVSWTEWIYKALVLLVIACPCALVISTPVTIMSGLTAGARQGILIKGGIFLELGRKLKYMVWDKTGTLTYGTPCVTDFEIAIDGEQTQIEQISYSLASHSDHPVSKAIATYLMNHQYKPLLVTELRALLGQGIEGVIDQEKYYLVQPRFVAEKNIVLSADQQDSIQKREAEGKTIVLLINNTKLLALIAVADTVRPEAARVIQQLKSLQIENIILSGDNTVTVSHIAKQLDVEKALGYQLPQDKANAIAQLTLHANADEKIGMIGDGINDAPALAQADMSFAMGMNGTDIAIETANIVLMDQDLRKIPKFIQLSQKTLRCIRQNIVFALSIKFGFFVLTLMGMGTMWLAVFADTGVSLLVILNGLRLLRFSARDE